MGKPIVAIVGRPNVGKSTLFNRLVGRRRAIVVDTPGATRDRNYGEATWRGRAFVVVDTGGFEPAATEEIVAHVRNQALLAVEEADLVLLLLDSQIGCSPDDKELVEVLRRSARPFLVVVNKIDGERHEERLYDIYSLGIEPLYAISAEHGRGVGDLLDELLELIPEGPPEEPSDREGVRFAVIGRPNVGKSSFVNKLLGMDRTLVSEMPGTTRDAIDTVFTVEGKTFVAIDTAGIRRKARVSEKVEAYSILRALRSLERCDVACLILDGTMGVTEQDVRIAGYTEEAGRALVLMVNKWDLVEKDTATTGDWVKTIREKMPFAAYAPVLFVSALTGQRIHRVLPLVAAVAEQHRRRVPTADVNACIEEAVRRHHPPRFRGRPVKVFYAAQIGDRPPTFAVVVNYPEGVSPSYRRYIVNRLRASFDFEGTPIKVRIRQRRRGRSQGTVSDGVPVPPDRLDSGPSNMIR